MSVFTKKFNDSVAFFKIKAFYRRLTRAYWMCACNTTEKLYICMDYLSDPFLILYLTEIVSLVLFLLYFH